MGATGRIIKGCIKTANYVSKYGEKTYTKDLDATYQNLQGKILIPKKQVIRMNSGTQKFANALPGFYVNKQKLKYIFSFTFSQQR